ncbi:MAG: hypothetical protein EBT92_08185 [Planctomycetes bacterium]|nr:hypothetical protein [Planctomycetota bacterium]NBY01228.1 hypothetical protein [Planctomycetota bacterium]
MPFPDYPCPKCNSWIDPPAGTVKGQKFICPRCEDTIVWQGPDIAIDAPITAYSYIQKDRDLPVKKSRTALAVVFVMSAMAIMALVFALSTQKERRSRDLAKANTDPRQSYLQWFAGDSSLIAVLDLQKLKASKELAELLNLDGFLKKNSPISKALGNEPEEIKLLALTMPADRPLASSLFLQTLKPINMEKVNSRLQATPSGYRIGRETFRYQIDLFPMQPNYSKIDDTTMAYTMLPERFEAISGFERAGLNHLSGKLRPLIAERIPINAPVWIAAQAGKWDFNSLKLFLPALPEITKPDFMEDMDAIAIWLESGVEPVLRCEIMGTSAEAVKKLEKRLESMPFLVENGIKSACRDNWLTLQILINKELANKTKKITIP